MYYYAASDRKRHILHRKEMTKDAKERLRNILQDAHRQICQS